MDKVKLSPRADKDLDKILQHTADTWGPWQLKRYHELIQSGFTAIELNPEIGKTSPDLPGRRLLTVGTHIIIYRILEKETVISRILHQHQVRYSI